MAFDNLQDLIASFERTNELVRLTQSLSPCLEISEVTDRVVKQGGPALLFANPRGYAYPVLTNAYGSLNRTKAIFSIESLNDLGAKFEEFLEMEPPKRFCG